MNDLIIGLFAVAAVLGLVMAIGHFSGRPRPLVPVAVAHGVFAATGLVLLLLAVLKSRLGGTPAIALGLLVLAALGGFGLLSFHLRDRRHPGAMLIGHALLAVAGFLTLLVAVVLG